MTKVNLKAVFNKPYNRESWQNLIHAVFPGVTFFSIPHPIPVPNEDIKEFYHTGNIRLHDGRSLAIFELHVSEKIKLKRNRVTLHSIITKYIDQESNHGVLALFDSSSEDYRFTFTAKDSQITESGFETKITDAKRFTYVFGPNETCRTAADRFNKLAEKKDSITINDVEDAFSVEKLNIEFFNKYKEQYEKFVCHLTGKRFVKQKGKWVEEVKHEPHEYMNSIFENEDKNARDFIKKSLGRMVFLYFLQKKEWMGCPIDRTDWKDGDLQFMLNYFNDCEDKEHFYSKFLVPLYFDCLNKKRGNDVFEPTKSRIPYLNGGLFEEEKLKIKTIDFPIEFWENLFAFFAEYNFTIDENDPFEQEVGIDPEMLGHIFENLLEDNKDKGAFYTPKPIVEYMCKESLIQYLKTHLFTESPPLQGENENTPSSDKSESTPLKEGNLQALENFIRNHDPGDPEDKKNYIRKNAEQIEKLLDDVKICDPAIGSGAFPMGLLQEIFWAKMTLDWTLNLAETKKKIIENSIYGVDIDSGAIDIARLRFWLSLIVDAEFPEPLPNLDYKIMQGNSLLESFEGIDLSNVMSDKLTVETVIDGQQDLLDFANNDPQNQIVFSDDRKQKVQSLKNRYFSESDLETKKDIHKQIDEIVLEHIGGCLEIHKDNLQLNISILSKELKGRVAGKDKATKNHVWNVTKKGKQLKQWELELSEVDNKFAKLEELQYSTDRPFFLWHLYFSEVFENTPSPINRSHPSKRGEFSGGFDIVIANPPYITIALGKEQNIFNEDEISIYKQNFSEVFEYKGNTYALFIDEAYRLTKTNSVITFIVPNTLLLNNTFKKLRQFILSKFRINALVNIKAKIFSEAEIGGNLVFVFSNQYKNLSNSIKIYNINKSYNQLSFLNHEFLSQDDLANNDNFKIYTDLTYHKLLKKISNNSSQLGSNVSFYNGIKTGNNKKFLSDIKHTEKHRPVIRGKDFNKYLEPIYKVFVHFDPEKLWSNTDESKLGVSPKVIIRQTSDSLIATIETYGHLTMDTTHVIYESKYDMFFILGLLNSSLLNWYYQSIVSEIGRTFAEVKIINLKTLPIKIFGEIDFKNFCRYVNNVLLNKQSGQDTQKLEDQIDLMVYKLYELTYEEAKIVDPELDSVLAQFGLSKEDFERMGVEELGIL